MITAVFGNPGNGKTAYMTAQAVELLNNSEKSMDAWLLCRRTVERMNRANSDPVIPLPAHAPVYSNYPVSVPVNYKKYNVSYYIDGFTLGLPAEDFKTVYVYPGSRIFLTEAQRYYDSRKSTGSMQLRDEVSRFFEEHRQFDLDIWLDSQRPGLIDKNIRDITGRFIEMLSVEVVDGSTVFRLREFTDFKSVENYLNVADEKKHSYVEKKETFPFDVFRYFDSKFFKSHYIPHAKQGFAVTEHPIGKDYAEAAELARTMYRQTAPEGFYRAKTSKEEKKK